MNSTRRPLADGFARFVSHIDRVASCSLIAATVEGTGAGPHGDGGGSIGWGVSYGPSEGTLRPGEREEGWGTERGGGDPDLPPLGLHDTPGPCDGKMLNYGLPPRAGMDVGKRAVPLSSIFLIEFRPSVRIADRPVELEVEIHITIFGRGFSCPDRFYTSPGRGVCS